MDCIAFHHNHFDGHGSLVRRSGISTTSETYLQISEQVRVACVAMAACKAGKGARMCHINPNNSGEEVAHIEPYQKLSGVISSHRRVTDP